MDTQHIASLHALPWILYAPPFSAAAQHIDLRRIESVVGVEDSVF
jgi:hypothetical protein